jgi:quinol monooxygenase YgiN
MKVRPETTKERTLCDREMWEILRRKQGYVTHRRYCREDASNIWLLYSEWESKRMADGARQLLQATPLYRRGQTMLIEPASRLSVELIGTATSTKGLELSDEAIAAVWRARIRVAQSAVRAAEEAWWKLLAAQSGHLNHVLFRIFDDPLELGAMSHWESRAAFEDAIAASRSVPDADMLTPLLTVPLAYTVYLPLPL